MDKEPQKWTFKDIPESVIEKMKGYTKKYTKSFDELYPYTDECENPTFNIPEPEKSQKGEELMEESGFRVCEKNGKLEINEECYSGGFSCEIFECPINPQTKEPYKTAMKFHTHPVGYPSPSTTDILNWLNHPEEKIMCIGGGESEKMVTCYEKENPINVQDWEAFLDKKFGEKDEQEHIESYPLRYYDDSKLAQRTPMIYPRMGLVSGIKIYTPRDSKRKYEGRKALFKEFGNINIYEISIDDKQ